MFTGKKELFLNLQVFRSVLFLVSDLPANSTSLAAGRKICKGQTSRGGSSLNVLALQKIDVLLVVVESVSKSLALPNSITKCT